MFYICSNPMTLPPLLDRTPHRPDRLAGRPHRRSWRSGGGRSGGGEHAGGEHAALEAHAGRRAARAAAPSRRPVPRRRRHPGPAAEARPRAGRAAVHSHRPLPRRVGGPGALTPPACRTPGAGCCGCCRRPPPGGTSWRRCCATRRWRRCWRPITGWGRSCARSAGCSGWIGRCCRPRGGGGGR